MNNTKEDIASMILNHLRENPDAGDTLEGISKWWLKFETINKSVDDVANALDSLVEKGIVIRKKTKGSNPIYKIYKEV